MNLKLVFDDNRAYEAFQFIFMGMTYARLPNLTPALAVQHHQLLARLVRISRADGAGRVLKKECELQLTHDEQIHLLNAMANTRWRPEVVKQVRSACEFLGAEFKEPVKEERQHGNHQG